MNNKNIVLFSSGISERNGILKTLREKLEERGYVCSYWRDLFTNSYDLDNIALLPMLIKKIPTFDYAILICEGHDITTMIREGKQVKIKTMRDNVLFEIGLCVMALGLSRTILVTDDNVHLPDDLTGVNGSLAVQQFIYIDKLDSQAMVSEKVLNYIEKLNYTSEQIDEYIKKTGDVLTPVVIGAASSIACGYVNNFIFRTLEWIDEGIIELENNNKLTFPLEKIHIHIIIPEEFTQGTVERANRKQEELAKGQACKARIRNAEFRYKIIDDELHIIDYPTTIVTSYDTAKMILSIKADDYVDVDAQKRFTAKELNLFEATIKSLLSDEFLRQILEDNYSNETEAIKQQLFDKVYDVISKRLTIERVDY